MPTKLQLLQMHAEALYVHDASGRMLRSNEPGDVPAPRVYLGRTTEGIIWRYRHDLPEELVAVCEAILADEPVPVDIERQAVSIRSLFIELLRHAPVGYMWEGPAWYFPERIDAPTGVEVVMVEPSMRFSGDRFTWLVDELELCHPAFVVLDGDRIVSLCHSSRNTPVAAEAGVETLEGYRGRGYAVAVVAAWAREVRAQGRIPLYSTHWENLASQGVARRLGLIPYAADMHLP